jgi:hypothetical protein
VQCSAVQCSTAVQYCSEVQCSAVHSVVSTVGAPAGTGQGRHTDTNRRSTQPAVKDPTQDQDLGLFGYLGH